MKNRSVRAFLPAMLVISFALPGAAATCTSVTMPDDVEVSGKKLVLNGLGLREATMLSVDVYVAGLYLESKSGDGEAIAASTQTKRLVLHFVRKVSRKQITDAWEEGFAKNVKDLAPVRARIDRLNGFMGDFVAGDEIVFTYVAGGGVTVAVKGKEQGTIEGDDFAKPFFSIWLGPTPPNAGLKKGLLGGGCP